VTHSFLMEAGTWNIQGTWLDNRGTQIPVEGKTTIAWKPNNWFSVKSSINFQDNSQQPIDTKYRAHLDDRLDRYTYILQHSFLGEVEGEGWICPNSIIQRFWALSDTRKRNGFETFVRLNEDKYYFSGGILAGHYLSSTIEATLERLI
jgi:hypothetical protein